MTSSLRRVEPRSRSPTTPSLSTFPLAEEALLTSVYILLCYPGSCILHVRSLFSFSPARLDLSPPPPCLPLADHPFLSLSYLQVLGLPQAPHSRIPFRHRQSVRRTLAVLDHPRSSYGFLLSKNASLTLLSLFLLSGPLDLPPLPPPLPPHPALPLPLPPPQKNHPPPRLTSRNSHHLHLLDSYPPRSLPHPPSRRHSRQR